MYIVGGWVGTTAMVLLGLVVGLWSPHLSNLVLRTPGSPVARWPYVLGLAVAAVLLVFLVLLKLPV